MATDSQTDFFVEISGLKKRFGEQVVLDGVDLNIVRGETTVILGQSGEGKSVLLKHLIGLLKPTEGSIKVDGQEIVHLDERQLGPVRKKVGILFQDGALFDSMTVAENVCFPLMERGVKDRDELYDRAREVLKVVGLEDHMAKMPIDISGGMRKRVALARSVVTRPQCVLYDEPTAGLDPILADSIDQLITRLEKAYHVTSIVVTHDMKSMKTIADRVAVLRNGKIYFVGTPEELNATEDQSLHDFINGLSTESGDVGI